MANKVLITEQDGIPKQIVFGNHAGDFGPATNNDLRITTDGSNELDVELALLNLADTAAAQSAKGDLEVNRAPAYAMMAAMEWQVAAAAAGEVVEFYMNASRSITAAVANLGGTSGAAAAYSGYSSDLADAIKQLIFVGAMSQTDDAVDSLQIGYVGVYAPPQRHMSLIVKNEAGQTLCDTDDIETHVTLDPIVDEIQ